MAKRLGLFGLLALVAIGAIALVGVVAGFIRPGSLSPAPAPVQAAARPAAPAPPVAEAPPHEAPALPAFSPAEEQYIARLRPIHERVRNETLAIAGASLEARAGQMPAPAYRALLDRAQSAYQESRQAVAALNPPPSLDDVNQQYLGALDQYLAAIDQLAPAADGNWSRLGDAIPALRAGNAAARDTALALWADEYIPN